MRKTGQGHHNTKDLPSADAVWQSLLGDLLETPLEIPTSWPDQTSARWDNGGSCLVVSAPPAEKEGWIEKRFLPLARIYFEQQHTGKNLVVVKKGGAEKSDLLIRVQRSVYEQIVEPQKIVPIQIYLFQHWLPVLGASAFWVTAAMRQVSFISKADEACVVKPISSRTLAKWAPLKHVQVNEWLSKEGFTSWFFKKTKESYDDVPPEYTVWSQVPVSPHHLLFVENYIQENHAASSPTEILESLLDKTGEIRRVKPGDLPVPPAYPQKRRAVLDVLAEYYPSRLSQLVSDLALQLEHQITRPNLSITLPHYFFHRYMDDLSPNEAALIWYLRSLYKEEGGAEVTFSGYSAIEDALGCGNRTPKRLLEKCLCPEDEKASVTWDPLYQPSLSLQNWLSAAYQGEYRRGFPREYTIQIRTTEPIHTADQSRYQRLLTRTMTSLEEKEDNTDPLPEGAQNRTGDAQFQTPSDETTPAHFKTGDTQNRTGVTQNQTEGVPIRTGEEQKETGGPRNTEHLNIPTTNMSFNGSFNDSVIPPPQSKPVGGGEEIDIEKLLGFGSYKHNEKKNLLKKIQTTPRIFLAWIIRNHITGADFPVRLAVSNLREGNETEDKYLEIAALGWRRTAQLASTSENDLSMWDLGIYEEEGGRGELVNAFKGLSKSARKEIVKLRDTAYAEIYENVKKAPETVQPQNNPS